MAKRSREHRQEIPGYNDSRPNRQERKQQHRAVRHSTHQILHMIDDPDEVVVPEVRGTGDNHATRSPSSKSRAGGDSRSGRRSSGSDGTTITR